MPTLTVSRIRQIRVLITHLRGRPPDNRPVPISVTPSAIWAT